MGLDTSHDAWHGAYSSFHRWRTYIAQIKGYNIREIIGYAPGATIEWPKDDPLYTLMTHSDCDGKISPEDCIKIADGLEQILDKFPNDDLDFFDYKGRTEIFIAGCRKAATLGEPLEFA